MITQVRKDTWLKNLRSGEYKQCYGNLSDVFTYDNEKIASKYCCLGVLVQGEFGQVFDIDIMPKGSYSWLSGEIGGENVRYLMDMNDTAKFPFPVIADWVEKHINAS